MFGLNHSGENYFCDGMVSCFKRMLIAKEFNFVKMKCETIVIIETFLYALILLTKHQRYK